ncbi:MAG: hypothetical protein ACK4WH_12680 [Phycisphaerales bacterium]
MPRTKNQTAPDRFSPRSLRTLSAFGLTVDDVRHDTARAAQRVVELAARLDSALRPGSIASITGPSGSGKTSILNALSNRPGRFITVAPSPRGRTVRSIDSVRAGSLADTLAVLAASGLAEARLMVARIGDLSEGERARVALAQALAAASRARGGPVTLIADEFAATLDDATADAVAASLARWVCKHSARIRLVTAGPRVPASLNAIVRIELPARWVCDGGNTRTRVLRDAA